MLDDGRIIYDGGLEELKSRWGKGRQVQFQFNDPVTVSSLEVLTKGLDVRWSQENEVTAKVWIPREMNVSEVLSRVVGVMEISDIKIFETNTDEIVREIYQSGSADAPKDLSALTDAGLEKKEPITAGAGAGES
jgi:ABC-2 type transport system ATP-binding protein